MGSTLFRDPQAQSSTDAALGTLQTWDLNRVDPVSIIYVLYHYSLGATYVIVVMCKSVRACASLASQTSCLLHMQGGMV